jgi:hypothetical protein
MRMSAHRGASLALIALLTVPSVACTSDPAPTPSPSTSGFASEEDAFAAAEATYRAYIDATNNANLEDPVSVEESLQYTTGEAKETDRETFESMSDAGLTVSGSSRIVSMFPVEASYIEAAWSVQLRACLDVSEIVLQNPDGSSAVSPDRPDVQNIIIDLVSADSSPTGLLITSFSSGEKVASCA